MSTLGIINSDPKIRQRVELAFEEIPGHNYDLLFLVEEDEILEFLNYALPELVVINFSDTQINVEQIIDHIRNDKWILNFGIIGLYSHETDKEEELLRKYKAINVLTLLDNFRLRTHLVKSIQIIEQNYQIIFQREFTKNLLEGASGSFAIDNDILAVPLYSGIGSTILAQRGLINPDSKMHLQLALAELIVNAIEHGNCGISYDEKTKALEEGISPVDLIVERCKDPVVAAKKVSFLWEIKPDRSIFIIQDQGKGFDVKAHIKKVSEQDDYSLHGRGIKMAASLSSELKYNAKGNQVALIINHDTSVEHEVPVGFSREQIVNVKKGDTVLREGEPSDYLYYISSGTYEVFHNDKLVGTLSPQDIFMGEMSFLLNQRRSATIKATSSGKLILLTQKTFINVIREYPHYGIFLSKLLAKRLVRSNEQTAARLSGDLSRTQTYQTV
ncbi:cyclic nucleotide-binding protein [Spirochaetia bacterium]|nr:cyclic nucleotide-binding protein [Spirochaetia bacterium]